MASTNFEDLILRGTRGSQPAAGVPGRLYYVTDESVTERDNGATWDDVSDSGASGATITEGVYASLPGSPTDNDVYLVTDGKFLLHRASSAWQAFGPLRQLTLPPAVSVWTWDNQGTSTADDTMGVISMVSQANAGQTLRALYKAQPTPTYTITALVSFDAPGLFNYGGCGIGFRENGSGKYAIFGPENADPGTDVMAVMKWNSTSGYTTPFYSASFPGSRLHPVWLRIKNDGSSLYYYVSNSGIQWQQVYTAAVNSHFGTAPDQVAIAVYQENGSVQSQATFWSWEET